MTEKLTREEQAYFDAQHDLNAAIQRATQAAQTALDSQGAEDLDNAAHAFEFAASTAARLKKAKERMTAAQVAK